jgi:hypothetical protein
MNSQVKTVWETLSAIDVNEHVKKKGKFNYLSWAWAWGTLKACYPSSTFEKHTFTSDSAVDVPYMRDSEGQTYVQVSVTVEGITLSEVYPVLNHQNKSITNPNSFDVNTALQRCLAKVIAMHGLGFYIFAGEDLPEADLGEVIANEMRNEAPIRDHPAANVVMTTTGDWKQIEELCEMTGSNLETVKTWVAGEGTMEGAIAHLRGKL